MADNRTMNARQLLADFERQFIPVQIPPGTPDRRNLQAAANAEAQRRACEPHNIERRLELGAAVAVEDKVAKLREAAERP